MKMANLQLFGYTETPIPKKPSIIIYQINSYWGSKDIITQIFYWEWKYLKMVQQVPIQWSRGCNGIILCQDILSLGWSEASDETLLCNLDVRLLRVGQGRMYVLLSRHSVFCNYKTLTTHNCTIIAILLWWSGRCYMIADIYVA